MDLDIKSSGLPTATVVKEVPKVPQVILDNNATQLFAAITPWVTGNTIDFLRTCRLKTIQINQKRLVFVGEHMSNIKKNQLGCGNARLDEITRTNGLKVSHKKNQWQLDIPLEAKPAQTTERKDHLKTIERLELLSQIIGWRLNILSTKNDGNKQQVTVLFQGKNLNTAVLSILSEGLTDYATAFKKGSLQFNPNNFDLLNAQLEIDIHTQSSNTL